VEGALVPVAGSVDAGGWVVLSSHPTAAVSITITHAPPVTFRTCDVFIS
jgi:hypothetical protein